TSEYLDDLKKLGYTSSTTSGITIGMTDVPEIQDKDEKVAKARKQVDVVSKQFRRGLITEQERHDRVISIWNACKYKIQNEIAQIHESCYTISIIVASGARGNSSNISQLAGMRGLKSTPKGGLFEIPVSSNFNEGLSVLELFMCIHGA